MSAIIRDPSPRQAVEPINALVWKNLDFTKDGRSFLAPMIHPSEEKAAQISDEFNLEMDAAHSLSLKDGNGGVEIIDGNGQRMFLWEEYSHTIQIPWCRP